MPLLADAGKKLGSLIQGSGFEDSPVVLRRAPDAPRCQYARGVCIEAVFGGKTGHMATDAPIEARILLSSLFGATLTTPQQRTAAVAMINAATGFLSMARPLCACRRGCYSPCLADLKTRIGGLAIYPVGRIPVIETEFSRQIVADPASAALVLVSADGLVSEEAVAALGRLPGEKPLLFLGPSTVGISSLTGGEHWCPYGR
jgi:hypothetical protein